MKKTLITLLALTGVAMADSILTSSTPLTLTSSATVNSKNAALTWSGDDTTLTSWSVSFDITCSNKTGKTGIGDAPLFSTRRSNGATTGLIFSSNTDGTVEIYQGNELSENSTASVLSIGNTTSITVSFVADYIGETYKGGTFVVTSGENKLLNFAVDATVENTTLISGSSSVWTQTGDGNCPANYAFSNITVSKLANNVVPEPATATLSLLALAGLAARRRRK